MDTIIIKAKQVEMFVFNKFYFQTEKRLYSFNVIIFMWII